MAAKSLRDLNQKYRGKPKKYADGGRVRRPAAAPVPRPSDEDYLSILADRAVGAGEPVAELRSAEGRGFAPMPRSFGEAGQRMSAVVRGDVEPTPEEERQINAVRGFAEGPASIRAYHGSPHLFERFDISKIGTGEGAQAYGHGLYFAELERLAREYRDILASPRNRAMEGKGVYIEPSPMNDGTWRLARPSEGRMVGQTGDGTTGITDYEFPSLSAAILRARKYGLLSRNEVPILTEIAEEGKYNPIRSIRNMQEPTYNQVIASNPGHMYEVRLRTTPEELVNWDAPLVRQPERAVPFLEDVLRAPRTGSARILEREMKPIGEAIDLRTPEIAAQLREAGIPGLRYLDAGSRTGRQNTRNYVMFGDDLIDITRRYAEGGLAELDQKYADGGMVREPATAYDPDEIDRIVQEFAEGGRARSPAAAPVATPFDADYIERLAAQAVGAGEPGANSRDVTALDRVGRRIGEAYQTFIETPERLAQQVYDDAVARGVDPESAARRAERIGRRAGLTTGAVEMAVPQTAADVAMMAAGPIGRVAPAAGRAALAGAGAMMGMEPSEAEASALRRAIRAYHGSPYRFDRFDITKIGTGEGFQ